MPFLNHTLSPSLLPTHTHTSSLSAPLPSPSLTIDYSLFKLDGNRKRSLDAFLSALLDAISDNIDNIINCDSSQ